VGVSCFAATCWSNQEHNALSWAPRGNSFINRATERLESLMVADSLSRESSSDLRCASSSVYRRCNSGKVVTLSFLPFFDFSSLPVSYALVSVLISYSSHCHMMQFPQYSFCP